MRPAGVCHCQRCEDAVNCEVVDFGLGMTEQVKRCLYSGKHISKNLYRGHGVRIVLKIARHFGWDISCNSRLNVGTVVRFSIPF